jgi:hypothetical protein
MCKGRYGDKRWKSLLAEVFYRLAEIVAFQALAFVKGKVLKPFSS